MHDKYLIAENDEKLMEKYFDEGDLSPEEITQGLKMGILNRDIFPVLITDANSNIGVDKLLDFIVAYTPSIADMGEIETIDGKVKPEKSEPFSGLSVKYCRK